MNLPGGSDTLAMQGTISNGRKVESCRRRAFWPRFAAALAALSLGFGASPAWGHPDRPLAPHDLWSAWAEEPWALAAIGAAAWLYARGAGRVWKRAGVGRGVPLWRFRCYAGGILALLIALVSPLDPLGGALFSAHMVQHELLIMIAAPLLVLGTPIVAFLWSLPKRWRRRVGGWGRARPVRSAWRLLTHPLCAWSVHAAAIWIWHAPRLYEATLTSATVHTLQHASFFGSALLFWWPLLHPSTHRRLGQGLAVIYLFTTAVYGSGLGAFLSLASRPWYPAYGDRAAPWGLTALEDQQLGGLIMWIPFGSLYTLAALALVAHWLRGMEAREVTATA